MGSCTHKPGRYHIKTVCVEREREGERGEGKEREHRVGTADLNGESAPAPVTSGTANPLNERAPCGAAR